MSEILFEESKLKVPKNKFEKLNLLSKNMEIIWKTAL